MAFGTGTHETTRMMCARLLSLDLHGKNILDCGSGTGILGICALKLGAAHCLAYDIDEWSADNTRHNAVINRVDERITVLHGDATLLDDIAAGHSVNVPADSPADFHEGFHIVMANINRNILLNDMERFVSVMAPKATLLLSGFYENDCAMLESKAQSLGLVLSGKFTDSEWACLTFSRL
jgi:ribosomal protein L11 methyltransferase